MLAALGGCLSVNSVDQAQPLTPAPSLSKIKKRGNRSVGLLLELVVQQMLELAVDANVVGEDPQFVRYCSVAYPNSNVV